MNKDMQHVIKLGFFVSLLMLLVVAVPVAAQDGNEFSGTCDAALNLLLLVAVDDYDFSPETDLSDYDVGEHGPLFAEAAANIDTAQSTLDAADEDIGDAADTLEGMGLDSVADTIEDAADAGDTAADAGETVLEQSEAAAEAAVCVALRSELQTFFLTDVYGMESSADE